MQTHLAESLAIHISLLTTQTQTLAEKSELLPYLSLLALHNQQLTQLTIQHKQTLEELRKENETLKLVNKEISQEVADLRRQQKVSLEENRHKLQELERAGKHEIEALKQSVKKDIEREVVGLRKMQENLEETKRKIRELEREKGTQATVITELRKCSDTSKREIQAMKLNMNIDISQEVAELRRQQKESLEECHCKIQELERAGKHEIETLNREVNKDVEKEVARLRKVQKECLEESQHKMQEFERKTRSQDTLITELQQFCDTSKCEIEALKLKVNQDVLQEVAELRKQQKESHEESQHKQLEVKKEISQEVADLRRQQKVSLEENRHKLQELERAGKHEIEALKQSVKKDIEREVVGLRKMQENLEETKRKIRELEREKGTQATVITELRKCSDTSKREIQAMKLNMNIDISQEVAELRRQQKESLEECHCKIQELERAGKHEIETLNREVNKDVEKEVARLRKVQKECLEESQHKMQEFERKTRSQDTLITELQQFCDTSKREIEALKLKVNKDVLQEVAELRKQQKESHKESQHKILELEEQNKVQTAQLQKYADTSEYKIEILKLKGSMDVEEQIAGVRKKLMHDLEKEKQSQAVVIAELQKCSYSSKREIEALKLKVNKDMEQEVAELRREQKESLEKSQHTLQELEREKQEQATVLALLQECSDKNEHQIGALNKVKSLMVEKVAELRRQQKEQKESREEILQELEQQKQGVTAQVQKCSDESERQIKALTVDVEQKAAELRRQQDEHRASLATLQMYVQMFPPIKFTVTTECEWPCYSIPFHSHPQGYKMCLKVFPHGFGIGQGTYVSVFVQLMKGDFDDCLQWPFQGTVVLQLCNHLQDKYHYGDTIDFSLPADHNIINRVTSGEVTEGSEWGTYTFIAHKFLDFNSAIYCQYLMNNSLLFRILAVECLSKPGVLPTELTMANFEQHKIDNDCWSSPQFYTHPQGYKMGLEVYVSRFYDECNTYISVYVHLLRGEFDGYLKWPFNGYVTVAMLNQLEDMNHAIETIRFSDATEYAGNRGFIPHTQLNYQPANNCQYLKYDCLRFRIVKVELL